MLALALIAGLLAESSTCTSPQEALEVPAPDPAPVYVVAAPHRSKFVFHETTKLTMRRVRSSMNGEPTERECEEPIVEQTSDRSWIDDVRHVGPRQHQAIERVIETAMSRVDLSVSQRGEQHETSTRKALEIEGKRILLSPSEPSPKGDPQKGAQKEAQEEAQKGARKGTQRGELKGGATPALPSAPGPATAHLEARWMDRPEGAAPLPWELAMSAGPTGEHLIPPPGTQELVLGQTWEVPGSAFAELLDPCSLPAPIFPMMFNLQDPDYLARFSQFGVHRAAQSVEGLAVGTWKGIRSQNKSRLAHMRFAVDLHLAADTTDWMREQSGPYQNAAIGRGASDAKLTMHVVGVANLYWDMDASRMAEFSLEADVTAEFDQDYEFDMMNTKFHGIIDQTMKGTTTVELFVTDAPQ